MHQLPELFIRQEEALLITESQAILICIEFIFFSLDGWQRMEMMDTSIHQFILVFYSFRAGNSTQAFSGILIT